MSPRDGFIIIRNGLITHIDYLAGRLLSAVAEERKAALKLRERQPRRIHKDCHGKDVSAEIGSDT